MKKKQFFILLLCIFCCLFAGCSGSALGLPEKDPAGTLRSYYEDGKDGKIADFYIKYKIIAETSNISYPSADIRPLPSQENMEMTEDMKHTLYHIALTDQSSTRIYHPLLTLDILSDKDWRFDTENTIISIEEDKILFEVTYGPNQSSTILYSIKDDTFTEVTTE